MKKQEQHFHRANKHALGEWLITRLLIQPAAARSFAGIYVHADHDSLLLRGDASVPVIFCLTHPGWWDGYMAGLLNRAVFKRDSYLMMEEDHLARYPFFTWIGIYGVDRDDPRKALLSIEYSASLLTERPGRALWIFPQGTITHPDTRPLGLYSGVAHIARRVGRCVLVPVALRYEFRLEQAPEAFARVGPPLALDPASERLVSREITSRLDAAISQTDDALRADLLSNNLRPYRCILRGRGSANRVWDGVVKRLKVEG